MNDRNRFSRLIDSFQFQIAKEKHNAANGVPRAMSNFRLFDAEQKWSPTQVLLYFHKMIAYSNPASFISETFSLPLKQIDNKIGVRLVAEAIALDIFPKKKWEEFAS